jgi:hypothetical protein
VFVGKIRYLLNSEGVFHLPYACSKKFELFYLYRFANVLINLGMGDVKTCGRELESYEDKPRKGWGVWSALTK